MAFAQENLRYNSRLLSALASMAQQANGTHATGQTMTAAFVALAVNSTSIGITAQRAGKWAIEGFANFNYVGATFAAVQTAEIQIYDATAAAVIDTFTADLEIVTTVTGQAARIVFPRRHVTAVLNNLYTLRAKVSVLPSAGTVAVLKAGLSAEFIG